MITIIDIGGNVGSISNMLKRVGVKSKISSDVNDIETADKLILPGVGAFDNGVKEIHSKNLLDVLLKKVLAEKTPILGVCLGMQLFTKRSGEGTLPSLGWIDAETIRFRTNLRIPHMGWNTLNHKDEPIFRSMPKGERFYFIHSYHVVCNDKSNVIATTNYGYDFASVIQKENIIGVQFHPEKSHRFGMTLLKNFSEM
jgi:glutamine amidotransferase